MNHVTLPGTPQGIGILPDLQSLVSQEVITAGGSALSEALWKELRNGNSQQGAVEMYLSIISAMCPHEVVVATKPPSGVDEALWQHESMRHYIAGLNKLVVHLAETCTPQTCPKMTATSEWLFLCACHKTPQECPAVDYAFHTLDGAATVLHSSKFFSERKEPPATLFANMIRRLYRIFAHAWHHHNSSFMEFEEKTKLCDRFVRFSLHFNLLQKDILMPYPQIAVDGS